jgi:(4-(4-[2-(gamma-L-glutamylamino)ethyl]phenoxymethyl)furan-2-yl)methanamine synthase
MATVLGLDIGGANLKAAHTDGRALSMPFALWKNPALLPDTLRRLLHDMPPADGLAITMTGELCDCFENKRQGVLAILDAVREAAGDMPIRVWWNDGRFVDVAAARKKPLQVASANWLALATFAGRYAPKGPALLIDIGSTTTDIIPLMDGRPVHQGRTDLGRLFSGELVYMGVRRTPLCALLGGYGAAELFATTLDVYLLLGFLPEDPADCNTADGRTATKAAAERRIARMLCADVETSAAEVRRRLIEMVLDNQAMVLGMAFYRVARRLPALPQTVLFAGEGEFLIRLALKAQQDIPPCRVVTLSGQLGPTISQAACAYAVAMLAAEE